MPEVICIPDNQIFCITDWAPRKHPFDQICRIYDFGIISDFKLVIRLVIQRIKPKQNQKINQSLKENTL